jgi:hypothetical protein
MKNFGFPEEVQFLPIIHLGRCGSTHLERSLSTSFAALSLGEIFNHGVTTPFLSQGHTWRDFFDDDLKSFLAHCVLRGVENRYWQLCTKSNQSLPYPKLVLFEYKPTLIDNAFHPVHSEFLLCLRELGMKRVVVLERRSVVRRLISSHSAAKTGIYHSNQQRADTAERERIHFDTAKVMDDGINPGYAVELRDTQDLNDVYFAKLRLELRAGGFDILNLEYERDLCGPITEVVKKVGRFVAQEPVDAPKSDLVKFLSNDLSKVLTNDAEVIEYCERHHLRL